MSTKRKYTYVYNYFKGTFRICWIAKLMICTFNNQLLYKADSMLSQTNSVGKSIISSLQFISLKIETGASLQSEETVVKPPSPDNIPFIRLPKSSSYTFTASGVSSFLQLKTAPNPYYFEFASLIWQSLEYIDFEAAAQTVYFGLTIVRCTLIT